ncbi:hypothetical protein [Segetibacter aerophilus]|uniref:Uncharacterized protein n=1 Tax=Segetibacter aerophilus TaxID=670293 RepID=A0A512BHC8_9BACT|nr:hypothetical protein [Segetibacter aerophilus]GEO11386.1 hypothetical protein SAE01_38820 [Segetibacter aerophilus]
MIDASELRIGNYILHKASVRILPVKCTFQHFELMAKGLAKDIFPIPLKPDILQKCGFVENKKYYLLPDAREFILTLPVMGNSKNEVYAYLNSNKESYARATVNDLVISNNFYYLHQLQNLYYVLLGKELDVML